MTDLQKARSLLAEGIHTCVLCRGEEIHTSQARGVRPLVRWLTFGPNLAGFSAADKVVGKATAYLYCLLQVKAVHAQVMSGAAAEVLHKNGIDVTQDKLVENIINRADDGICPFEAAVWDIHTPEEALPAIRKKMAEMNIAL